MKPAIIYCYDAYCGWCYGFSPVIKKIVEEFKHQLDSETLSGGMILPEKPVHISVSANYIANAYKHVEELTGITFGKDYLWHIMNPGESDWYPNSEKPAIAMCVFKEFYPHRSVEFASDLQYALHFEGRDLTDDQAYLHLIEKYSLHPDSFFEKLASDTYKGLAYEEFAFMQQLGVNGYPTVFIQNKENRFTMVARGFTEYDTLKERIERVLETEGK